MELSPPILVQTPAAWQACLADLTRYSRLAVDMESNGLHAYRERVCLIQISTSHQDYIIDPLSLPDLEGLGDLMADPAVEKIFHAAEYDLLSMKRDYGYTFNHLFDTMLAARILGWRKIGLGSILEKEFGVKVNKRFQRANWGHRPLSEEQIAYARKDTHYLFDLRDRLERDLKAADRWQEAQESFERISEVTPTPRSFDPDDFWQLLNGHYQFAPQQNAVLRELYILREREAQRRDRPPFKIFGNRTLLEITEALPQYPDEFQGIFGLTPSLVKRYGRQLIQAVQNGLQATPPKPVPRRARPPEVVLGRFDALMRWRKERAQKRGVESDVIVSKKALWALAYRDPKETADLETVSLLGDWQRDHYGQEILDLLDEMRKNR